MPGFTLKIIVAAVCKAGAGPQLVMRLKPDSKRAVRDTNQAQTGFKGQDTVGYRAIAGSALIAAGLIGTFVLIDQFEGRSD